MLPTLKFSTTIINIPSSKKKIPFRPFLAGEEKILLMAKESSDNTDIFLAIKNIVQVCCLEPLFKTDELTIFDLEYVFLKLRAISVDNTCSVTYTDSEDEKDYSFVIDLNTIEVVFPENVNKVIKITDDVGITMRYPQASLYQNKEFLKMEKDQLFELIIHCVDSIYEKDQVFERTTIKNSEMVTFLNSIPIPIFNNIKEFLSNAPMMSHELKYTNTLGHERKIVLRSLDDFFTLR